jgi:hypothetical protein
LIDGSRSPRSWEVSGKPFINGLDFSSMPSFYHSACGLRKCARSENCNNPFSRIVATSFLSHTIAAKEKG